MNTPTANFSNHGATYPNGSNPIFRRANTLAELAPAFDVKRNVRTRPSKAVPFFDRVEAVLEHYEFGVLPGGDISVTSPKNDAYTIKVDAMKRPVHCTCPAFGDRNRWGLHRAFCKHTVAYAKHNHPEVLDRCMICTGPKTMQPQYVTSRYSGRTGYIDHLTCEACGHFEERL